VPPFSIRRRCSARFTMATLKLRKDSTYTVLATRHVSFIAHRPLSASTDFARRQRFSNVDTYYASCFKFRIT
jgi:hypothetical protein